jgi:hypothetical protein
MNTCVNIFVMLLFVYFNPLNAQNDNGLVNEKLTEKYYSNSLALLVGYTFIPKPSKSHGKLTYVVPTLGVDYIYKFNQKIAVAAQTDVELASYVIERGENETLEREYAFVIATVFIYEPVSWWAVFGGPGYEFEKNESFFVARLGTEFIKRFEDGWGFSVIFTVDIKQVNTAPGLGITIFKGFGKSK